MSLEKPPIQIDKALTVWLNKLWVVVYPSQQHGTTAQRPTTGLYIGMDYFDDTLGHKVTLKSANPNVWVDGVGTVV